MVPTARARSSNTHEYKADPPIPQKMRTWASGPAQVAKLSSLQNASDVCSPLEWDAKKKTAEESLVRLKFVQKAETERRRPENQTSNTVERGHTHETKAANRKQTHKCTHIYTQSRKRSQDPDTRTHPNAHTHEHGSTHAHTRMPTHMNSNTHTRTPI